MKKTRVAHAKLSELAAQITIATGKPVHLYTPLKPDFHGDFSKIGVVEDVVDNGINLGIKRDWGAAPQKEQLNRLVKFLYNNAPAAINSKLWAAIKTTMDKYFDYKF